MSPVMSPWTPPSWAGQGPRPPDPRSLGFYLYQLRVGGVMSGSGVRAVVAPGDGEEGGRIRTREKQEATRGNLRELGSPANRRGFCRNIACIDRGGLCPGLSRGEPPPPMPRARPWTVWRVNRGSEVSPNPETESRGLGRPVLARHRAPRRADGRVTSTKGRSQP